MRSLLSLAHCHGGILGTAWHMVLTTLQVSFTCKSIRFDVRSQTDKRLSIQAVIKVLLNLGVSLSDFSHFV